MSEQTPILATGYFLGAVLAAAMLVAGLSLAAALICGVAALAYCYLEISSRKAGIVHVDIAFVLFFTIYSLNLPIFAHISPKDLSLDIVDRGLLICIFCHMGLALGLIFVRFRSVSVSNNGISSSYQLSARQINIASYILFFVGLVGSVVAVMATVGFQAYLGAGYAGRALLKREAGPIEIGLYVCAVSLIAIFSVGLIDGARNRARLFLYCATVFFVAYVAYLGIRRPMFLLICGLFSAFSIIRFRPKISGACVVVLPLFVILSTFAHYRQVISSDGVAATIDFIRDNASVEWLDVSDNELGAPFRTLYDEIPFVDKRGFGLGISYLSSPVYMLPSFINGGVVSLSGEYTDRHFDPRFISIGGNMGYFPATEAFYNFGLSGCLVIFLLMIILLGRINIYAFENWRNNAFGVTIFATIIPWLAFFIRLDFGSFAKSVLYSQAIWFMILYCLARSVRREAEL
ncbi:O-antigen polysaccharide polymerase Wzy family protein [Sphingobium sp. CFD-2]|uniref:O-antigen polysaccharide polymerase Wzy family protein n=1 Tax=Sphingobium sp. CFD-2 TaxID=2878542 RepID=UPI00214CB7B2|nr:O-antigen polysaccharide polymerase Wzy family protein [Sphingobium sp. CFD-2]